jgi:acyl-lipid Delta6-acetylenase / acyl-lipid (9-3)-desaturase
MPVTAKNIPESENSVKYTAIKKRVKHLIKPNYFVEVGLALLTFAMFLAGSFTNNWFAGIILLGLAQNVGGWIGHSQSHCRDPFVNKMGNYFGALCIGLSARWWNRKHNLHHMFTNNFSKD